MVLVVRRVRITAVVTTCQVPVGWTLPLALCVLIDALFPTRPVMQDVAGIMAGSTTLELALMAGVVTL